MRYFFEKRKKKKFFEGYALLLVVILISVMSIIVLSLSLTLMEQIRSNRATIFSTQAFYTAESGMERAFYALYQEKPNIPVGGNISFSGSLLLNEGDESLFVVTIERFDDHVSIKSKGTYHQVARDLEGNIFFTSPQELLQ